MIGTLIFAIALTLFLALLRYLGAKSYPIFYKEERPVQNKFEHEIDEAENDDEIIAVISAAVGVAIRKPFVVKKIKFIDPHNEDLAWKRAGRLSIMSSHTVQHK